MEKALKGLEVGVLINNVGVSYEFPMYFEELSDEQVRACLMGEEGLMWWGGVAYGGQGKAGGKVWAQPTNQPLTHHGSPCHTHLPNQPKQVHGLLELNVVSTTYMTRVVLPGMAARKKGAIVNLASAASRNPSPLLALYSGAKSFIEVRFCPGSTI